MYARSNFKKLSDVLISIFSGQKRHVVHYNRKTIQTNMAGMYVVVLVSGIAQLRSNVHIEGLVQDCSNIVAIALELLQSCINPTTCQG